MGVAPALVAPSAPTADRRGSGPRVRPLQHRSLNEGRRECLRVAVRPRSDPFELLVILAVDASLPQVVQAVHRLVLLWHHAEDSLAVVDAHLLGEDSLKALDGGAV